MSWGRRIGAMAFMLVGFTGTYGLVIAMNVKATLGGEEAANTVPSFEVAPPKKKPPQRQQRKKKSKPKKSSAKTPPMPMLSASLSGVDFGLPGMDGGFDDITDSLLGDVQDTVMTAETVTSLPEPMSRVAPIYPSRARARGVEGLVVMSVLVSEEGEVQDARVVEASPAGVFEEVALAAVKQWSFRPAEYEGRNVSIRIEVPMRFALQ